MPGLAHDRDDHAAPLDETVDRPLEHRELEVASDQRAVRDERLRLPDARHAEGLHRRLAAAQGLLAELLEQEAALDLPRGDRAEDDAAGRRQVLEARRDVHRVAERVPRVGPVAVLVRADDDRAGVDPDARGELDPVGGLHLLRVAAHRPLDGERGPHGALRVVLVGDRSAEDGVELVSAELGDGAVVAANLLRHDPVHLVDRGSSCARAELLADLGGARRDRRSAPRRSVVRLSRQPWREL